MVDNINITKIKYEYIKKKFNNTYYLLYCYKYHPCLKLFIKSQLAYKHIIAIGSAKGNR